MVSSVQASSIERGAAVRSGCLSIMSQIHGCVLCLETTCATLCGCATEIKTGYFWASSVADIKVEMKLFQLIEEKLFSNLLQQWFLLNLFWVMEPLKVWGTIQSVFLGDVRI